MPTNLPFELTKAIIGHLEYETDALMACRLTSRTFYSIAETYHLHHLVIPFDDPSFSESSPIVKLLTDIRNHPQHRLSLYQSLSLRLIKARCPFDQALLLDVLRSLVGLVHISISYDKNWSAYNEDETTSSFTREIFRECCRPTITRLSLSGNLLPSDDLQRCTSLVSLSLKDSAFILPKEPPTSRIPIKSFYVGPFTVTMSEGTTPGVFFHRYSSCPWDLCNLEAFAFLAQDDIDYRVSMAITRYKSNPCIIATLAVEIPQHELGNTPSIYLGSLPRLARLAFRIEERLASQNSCLFWLVKQLRTVHQANQLSELHLWVTIHEPTIAGVQKSRWCMLDDCLMEDRFNSLRDVRIGVRLDYKSSSEEKLEHNEVVGVLRAGLRKTDDQKLLRIDVSETRSMRQPRLPRELERLIFDISARNSDPEDIQTLMDVAPRVHVWLKPIFREIVIYMEADDRWGSYPTDKEAQYVKHLLLPHEITGMDVGEFLSQYPNIQSLAMWVIWPTDGVLSYFNSSAFANTILRNPFRRLAINLVDLFAEQEKIDFNHEVFKHLTHLEVFGQLDAVWEKGNNFVCLKELRYLAFRGMFLN
ncbi:hypothetical protein AX16_001237 [Volvariella volvacea WC 439]|nr:hypothetical protein AX16_001237 [Volvariella volvacea WC 439]